MSAYQRELVEQLVPTIWDRSYAWGMVNERQADPSMPKSKGAKNTKNTLWAHLADIRRAWDGAGLTLRQRQALVLCGGFGYTHAQVGAELGMRKQTAQEHYEAAVSALMRFLNGDDPFEEEDFTAA